MSGRALPVLLPLRAMTTNTTTFEFAGLSLRCVTIDGKPWFVAADVCKMLGLSDGNVYQHTKKLDAKERLTLPAKTFPGKGMTAPTAISESGLYKLVMRA